LGFNIYFYAGKGVKSENVKTGRSAVSTQAISEHYF
jgi:hypothetical protein